jgi:error-prone DNA polymerase
MHPWADLRPAGQEASQGPSTVRKLWHQSPGSAG